MIAGRFVVDAWRKVAFPSVDSLGCCSPNLNSTRLRPVVFACMTVYRVRSRRRRGEAENDRTY